VGDYGPVHTQPLVEHYDGNAWDITTIDTDTSASVASGYLNGVTCVSATDCWAVGAVEYVNPSSGDYTSPQEPLVEQYDGSRWSVTASPSPQGNAATAGSSELESVTCVNASDCWAVGYGANDSGSPLFEQFDGDVWKLIAVTGTAGAPADLNSVTCTSSRACLAVGAGGAADDSNVIDRFDGNNWTTVTLSTAAANGMGLAGVTCFSIRDCWAVGSGEALKYNGGSWSLSEYSWETLTNPGDELNSMVCIAAASCWGIGGFRRGEQTGNVHDTPPQPLIEHYVS
jgi:hypothetical protein